MKCGPAFSVVLALVLSVGMAGLQAARAENSGLRLKPVLGWSSWSFRREHLTAAKFEGEARALSIQDAAAGTVRALIQRRKPSVLSSSWE